MTQTGKERKKKVKRKSGQKGGRKEGTREKRDDETKVEKYGGGINQNVRITARCLNFEKGSI